MKTPGLILLFIVIPFYAFGQSIYDTRVGFNLIGGSHFPVMSALNKDLKALNLEPLKSAHGSVGFGLNININRNFFEFTYNFFGRLETNYNSNDIGTRSDGFSGGINYGQELILADYVTVIPFVGVNIDYLNVHIIDKNSGLTNFYDVLDVRNQTDLKFRALGVNIGSQFIIPIDWENVFAGIKMSYTFPFKSSWETDDVKLTTGPKINPGGFFVGLNYIFYI